MLRAHVYLILTSPLLMQRTLEPGAGLHLGTLTSSLLFRTPTTTSLSKCISTSTVTPLEHQTLAFHRPSELNVLLPLQHGSRQTTSRDSWVKSVLVRTRTVFRLFMELFAPCSKQVAFGLVLCGGPQDRGGEITSNRLNHPMVLLSPQSFLRP